MNHFSVPPAPRFSWSTLQNWVFPLTLVLAVSVLWPMLQSGYYQDDASFASLPGRIAYRQTSLLQEIVELFFIRIQALGRTSLFPFLAFPIFYYIQNLLLYKLLILAATLLNLLVFHRLVLRLSGSLQTANLSTLLVVGLFQFRVYHDPILSFNCLMQVVFLLALLALICLLNYLELRGKVWFYLSVLLYGINLYLYEINLLFILLYLWAIVRKFHFRRRSLILSLPFLLLGLSSMLLAAWLRSQAQYVEVGGYLINWNLGTYLLTLARQLVAALPLSYFVADPKQIFPSLPSLLHGPILGPFDWARFWLGAGLVYLSLAFPTNPGPRLPWLGHSLPVLGLLFWLLPAPLISLSAKYQKEIVWGVGYLPVYLQYFGVALLFTWAVTRGLARIGHRRWRQFGVGLVAGAMGLVLLVTGYTNRVVVAQISDWHDQHSSTSQALQAGLLAKIPDHAQLLLDRMSSWTQTWGDAFYYQYAGKRVQLSWLDALPLSQFRGTTTRWYRCDARSPLFLNLAEYCSVAQTYTQRNWVPLPTDPQGAAILLGQVEEMSRNPQGTCCLLNTQSGRLFVSSPALNQQLEQATIVLRGLRYPDLGENMLLPPPVVAQRGPTWRLYDWRSPVPVENATLQVLVNPEPVQVNWTVDFLPPSKDSAQTERWSGRLGAIEFVNNTLRSYRLTVNLSLAAVPGQPRALKIEGPGLIQTRTIGAQPQPLQVELPLQPGKVSYLVLTVLGAEPQPQSRYFRVQDFRLVVTPLP